MVAASGPPTGSGDPPHARCPCFAAVESGAVGPDGIPSRPRACSLECALLALHYHLAWEEPAVPPLLGLNRVAWTKGGCSPKARRKGCSFSVQDLLWTSPCQCQCVQSGSLLFNLLSIPVADSSASEVVIVESAVDGVYLQQLLTCFNAWSARLLRQGISINKISIFFTDGKRPLFVTRCNKWWMLHPFQKSKSRGFGEKKEEGGGEPITTITRSNWSIKPQ